MGAVGLAIKDRDFEAEARVDGPPQLRLSGNADASIVTQLTSLVTDLHAQLIEAHCTQLVVDIRDVEFMNATCFNVFVSWVNLINDLPPEQRYQLRFSTNPAIPWQRRSLRTLSCFATDLILVES